MAVGAVWQGGERREVVRARAADGVALALTRLSPRAGTGIAALLVHGFGQNRYLFDLPGRSFAAHLAWAGWDTYVLELRGHGLSRGRGGPYARRIADYADLDLPAALGAVRRQGAREVVLVGHSMGGVACMAAPPEVLRAVRAVVAIASPTNFGRGAPGVRVLSAMAAHLVRAARPGRPPPRALPTEIMGAILCRHVALFDLRLPLPLPVRIWEPGQIERPLLRAYLTSAFDREATGAFFDLARWARHGSFDRTPGGESIRDRLAAYPVPILFVTGRQDRLVPPLSVRPGYEATRAPRKSWRVFGGGEHRGRYGHVDLLLGRHAPGEVWTEIVRWLRESR